MLKSKPGQLLVKSRERTNIIFLTKQACRPSWPTPWKSEQLPMAVMWSDQPMERRLCTLICAALFCILACSVHRGHVTAL